MTIYEFVASKAAQMNIQLSQAIFVKGSSVGCIDAHLLKLSVENKPYGVLVLQSELDALINGSCCEGLEYKIEAALSQLLPFALQA